MKRVGFGKEDWLGTSATALIRRSDMLQIAIEPPPVFIASILLHYPYVLCKVATILHADHITAFKSRF